MADDPGNSDYLIGRFFIVLLMLVGVIFATSAAWFLHTGVSYWRGNVSVRADDADGFWVDIAFHGIIAVGAWWLAYSIRDFAKRK
jgi:hypothetical protein